MFVYRLGFSLVEPGIQNTLFKLIKVVHALADRSIHKKKSFRKEAHLLILAASSAAVENNCLLEQNYPYSSNVPIVLGHKVPLVFIALSFYGTSDIKGK